jgi:hypothetical protein
MKFIVKCIFLLLTISLSLSAKLKRTKNTPTNVSDYDRLKAALKLGLPAEVQKDNIVVVQKANQQTEAARKLFAKPGPIANEILKTVSKKISKLLIDEDLNKKLMNTTVFNRAKFRGILDNTSKKATEPTKRLEAAINRKNIQNFLFAKVADETTGIKAIDRAGVVAMMGDIGTAIFDCVENSADKKIKIFCEVKKIISSKFEEKGINDITGQANVAKTQRGGSTIAKNKKDTIKDGVKHPAERDEMKTSDGNFKLEERSKLLSTTTDDSDFKASWPWQLLPEVYMKKCAEPWAGHYSGSIVEILFSLDLFTQIDPIGQDIPLLSFGQSNNPTNKQLDTDARKCKAALGAAFLLSVGYHSAIEVKPTIWAYLGRGEIGKKPEIFSMNNQICDVSATQDIVELMKNCTATAPN